MVVIFSNASNLTLEVGGTGVTDWFSAEQGVGKVPTTGGEPTATARRWWRTLLAVAAIVCLGLITAPPAAAKWAEQYWFGTLSVAKAWGITKGAGVTVAVVDSGVDAALGDLRGQVLAGADFSGRHTDGRSNPGRNVMPSAATATAPIWRSSSPALARARATKGWPPQ